MLPSGYVDGVDERFPRELDRGRSTMADARLARLCRGE